MNKRTVTMTNEDVINLVNSIIEFEKTAQENNDKLPANLVYAVSRNKKLVGSVFEKYDKKRNEILLEYVERDKDGKFVHEEVKDKDGKVQKQIKFKDEEKLEKELAELFKAQVEVQFYKPFKTEEKLEGVLATQKTLDQLFTLLDIFENWEGYAKAK